MDLKEQYKQQHAEAIAVAEKMASSLGPIGASATLKPEIGLGGGGVGTGFSSPYITVEVGTDAAQLTSKEGHLVHQIVTQGTTPDKGLAHAVAQVLNHHLCEAQPVNASRLARANGNSININLEALSSSLRNNPQLEGVMSNLGSVVQQTVLAQVAQAQQAGKAGQATAQAKPQAQPQAPAEQAPKKKIPVGFQPNPQNRWADSVKASREQAESQGHSR